MRAPQVLVLAVAAASSAGFTECDAFHQVTVPPTDHDPPTIYNAGYDETGRYRFLAKGDELHLARADESMLALAS
ncbi:MAG TPA: hypothetical protein VGP87_06720, partial [Gemmatimonadales bacterium]|nr:hypothetical protein [Gemmatimonadales bacterium]